jgi:hypothetical protein
VIDDPEESAPLFDDIAEDAEPLAIDRESSDRDILRAIWTCREIGDLPADEAWAILYERYPREPRFLLLNAYEELAGQVPGVWTPDYFLKKVVRAREQGGTALRQPTGDLLTVAWSAVFSWPYESGASRRAFGELTTALAIGPERPPSAEDVEEAYARLSRFSASVVRELHDKTIGGTPIDPSARCSTPAASDYEQLIAGSQRTARTYASNETYVTGEIVAHSKFGLGVVRAVERGRIEILFKDGARKLVSGG